MKDTETNIYKCPYEGVKCDGNKHCHVLETIEKLPAPITAVVKCPIRHNEKIPVKIGN